MSHLLLSQMPPMSLSPKRVIVPLAQGRWTPIPAKSCLGPVRSIRSSPAHDAEEIDFSGSDVRLLPYFAPPPDHARHPRKISFYQYYVQNPPFEIQSHI